MANVSSLNADDFVFYGTAVAQLEKDEEISSKPVPIHEQIVTDEKGKQRFHGAFTGGFHAGYWDTVGSLEGWTPRTFKSSRERKGPSMEQRPEDYMDNEDLGEFGIAPKKISTTSSFASSTGQGGKRTYGVSGPHLGFKDLIPPLSDSYGVLLLKKFGWKLGQGIGPRISKREKICRAIRDGEVVPKNVVDVEEEDSLTAGKLFAPTDVKLIKMVPKSNYHGIGYTGLDISSDILSSKTQSFSLFDVPETSATVAVPTAFAKRSARKGMSGQAFGVGAFEADDGDIYATDDLAQYDRVLDIPGKKVKDARKPELRSIEAPGIAKILEGFQLGTTPLHKTKTFLPPEIPRSFTGQHGRSVISSPVEVTKEVKGKHHMDARSRSAVLEEKPVEPEKIKSVFDLIPLGHRSRLPLFQRTAQKNDAEAPVIPEPIKDARTAMQNVVSVEEQRRNNLALFTGSATAESKLTFRPFEKDPAKQRRYEYFLQKRREKNKDAIEEVWMDIGSSMTEWERERERTEFFRAADLYRPMSGAMAARFTTEKTKDETSNEVEVPLDKTDDISKERKDAIAKKLYGRLTHDEFEWHPDKLVCKRFNVPNPYPMSSVVGLLKVKKDKLSLFNFLNLPDGSSTEVHQEIAVSEEGNLKKETDNMLADFVSTAAVEITPKTKLIMPDLSKRSVLVEKQKQENEKPVERPPMDIFRAIFQDSDIDEIADEEEEETPVPVARGSEEKDVVEMLFELERSARQLEKKEYPVKPSSPPVIGPVKPPAELLAAYATIPPDIEYESDHEKEGSDKKKKHKRHSKERKKHKKHRKRKRKNHSTNGSSEDLSTEEQSAPQPIQSSLEPKSRESPDVDELLFRKLKQMAPVKRPTAADFF